MHPAIRLLSQSKSKMISPGPKSAAPVASSFKTCMNNDKCFVYGTLMAPEVLKILIGRVPSITTPALLPSYRRHPVNNQVYPAVIPSSSFSSNSLSSETLPDFVGVQGVLINGLNANEMEVFDWFEDVDYANTIVKVLTPKKKENGTNNMYDPLEYQNDGNENNEWEEVNCHAYIWANPVTELDLTSSWDYDNFRRTHLDWYLKETVWPCRIELSRLGI